MSKQHTQDFTFYTHQLPDGRIDVMSADMSDYGHYGICIGKVTMPITVTIPEDAQATIMARCDEVIKKAKDKAADLIQKAEDHKQSYLALTVDATSIDDIPF